MSKSSLVIVSGSQITNSDLKLTPDLTHVKSIDQLNYERISIITDADFDGYAIRSIILSFFFEYWPELFQLGFIYYSSAPLYEVDIKPEGKNSKVETVYCIDDNDFNSR